MTHLVEEKQHARLSPSGATRWMTCPGSVQLAEKLNIEELPSKYAAEGTVAHEVHERCLTAKNSPDKLTYMGLSESRANHYLGRTFEADGMKFTVSQNMVDAVQLSLDYIADRISLAALELSVVETQVEVRSSLEYLGVPGLDGGTADVVLLFWDELNHLSHIEVFDYKHGAGVAVEATNNPQAMCYALGIVEKYNVDPETTIDITISQPRAHHPDGPIRSWTTTAKDLRNWQDEHLVPAAKATREDNAPLVPSDSACRFCKAAGQCPKLFERTQEVAMLDFDDPEPQLPDVQKLSAEQKRFVMDHAAMLRSFIVAVEEQVKSEVERGSKEYEAHYKLVRKTTRRRFVDDAADELVSPLFDHLEYTDIFEEKPRSMSEIERRLKKAIGVQQAKEIMSDVTTKPEGEVVIAPLADKRKAVEPTAISDFATLEN